MNSHPPPQLHVWIAVYVLLNVKPPHYQKSTPTCGFVKVHNFRSPECTKDDNATLCDRLWTTEPSESSSQILITAGLLETMAPRQHKAVLHCQYLQRTVGSAVCFFFLLHLALKNAVLIKFSFWHRLPREALMRRRRKKQAQVSMTDPAEWEGSSAGRVRGENHLYPFPLFAHFHFEGPPLG